MKRVLVRVPATVAGRETILKYLRSHGALPPYKEHGPCPDGAALFYEGEENPCFDLSDMD